jgi:hypothetical protein
MHLAAPYMIDRFPHGSDDAESGKPRQNDQRLGCALLVFLGACLMMTVSLAASEMPIGHCSLPIMKLERGEPAVSTWSLYRCLLLVLLSLLGRLRI